MNIVHNEKTNRFEAFQDDGTAAGHLEYSLRDGDMYATHTWTEPAFRGGGVAGKMLEAMVGYARANGKRIVPVCSYVVAAFERSPQKYGDVIGKAK